MNREKLLDMLTLHEGLELKPYQCTSDKLTIGVGRNIEDIGITEEEARYLLQNDLDRILKEVEHWSFLEKLDEVRQAVILDMVFNMGVSKFNANTWVKTFAAIQDEDWEKVININNWQQKRLTRIIVEKLFGNQSLIKSNVLRAQLLI